MRALVVYESMYGNTRAVATDIAAGLSATHEVTLVPVSRATREMIMTANLIVVGGPTHLHGMSTVASRRAAVETAREQGSGLTMDPDADGPGLRGWLEQLRVTGLLAASFDTRFSGLPAFAGRASRGIARVFIRKGCRLLLLLPPESFLVETFSGEVPSRRKPAGRRLSGPQRSLKTSPGRRAIRRTTGPWPLRSPQGRMAKAAGPQ